MSKIADYLKEQEKKRVKAQEERERQTVADFAKELNKTADVLMEQLREAGVQKISETDRITETDKQALLSFLQRVHGSEGSRKKITLNPVWESEEDRCLKAVAEQENGAEWKCLERFAGDVIFGNKINHKLQTIVNLIVAKAVIFEALPMKKLGRPKSQETEDLGRKVAKKYWDLRDSGSTYSEAVSRLADEIHKDERHVMRLVEKHKKSIGLTFEDRERSRQWAAMMREFGEIFIRTESVADKPEDMEVSPMDSYASRMRDILKQPEFTAEDCIEYLDEQIVKTMQSKTPTDIK